MFKAIRNWFERRRRIKFLNCHYKEVLTTDFLFASNLKDYESSKETLQYIEQELRDLDADIRI